MPHAKEIDLCLSEGDCKAVDDAIGRLDALERPIKKLEECGIDCQERRAHVGMLREFFGAIKEQFYPKPQGE